MDDQLSLAIGRDGQNARLAAKLTGWRIDIKSLLEAAGDAIHRLQSDVEFASMAENETETVPRVELILGKKAEGRPITPEEYQYLSQFVDRVEKGLIHRRTAEKLADDERRKEIRSTIPAIAFSMPLEELALTDRIYDLLSASGYETIGDLMFQLALDQDAVLGLSGIGPKAMEEITEKLTTLTFPSPEPEVITPEEVAPSEIEAEKVEEVSAEQPETVPQEQPEEAVEVPSAEVTPEGVVEQLAEEAKPEAETGEEVAVPTAEGEVTEGEPEKVIDFNEIFTLRPEILGVQTDTEEEEEEEDLDKKGKKKKKKKKFVEVVYDPDRDITVVKRKRKRGGWEDDWNV
jgi:transcription termination/antitermination protein NusA